MPDMLVSLLKLPPVDSELAKCREMDVTIRRVQTYELTALRRFIETHFNIRWADEASAGLINKPVSTLIATRESRIIGFGCYECTCRDYFGPTGVLESERGKGIGRALLIACLHGLREQGYAYAIIGGAGPTTFYEEACGARAIPDSQPGIYVDMLKNNA